MPPAHLGQLALRGLGVLDVLLERLRVAGKRGLEAGVEVEGDPEGDERDHDSRGDAQAGALARSRVASPRPPSAISSIGIAAPTA